jgi:PPOX class probable F420-dependent enzyme
VPRPPLPDDVRALLARPNPAVMATLSPHGHPVTVATWYLLEDDGTILLNLDAGRARLRHLRADPRVSLTALAEGDWYTHVSVQGRVTTIADDDDLVDIDRLSRHYTGHGYSTRDRARVSVHVAVDRWHGWGAAHR